MNIKTVVASMQKSGGPMLGDVCNRCQKYRRVAITNQTLHDMIDTIHPVLHSIAPEERFSGRAYLALCPNCDAYALGAELADPFPYSGQ